MSSIRVLLLLLLLLALSLHDRSVVHAGWIDMDTPLDKRTTKSFVDGTTYDLVMSDEFNVDNRTFKDGHDPMWTALDKSDDDASSAGGGSMQFYNSSAVTTEDGFLKISTYRQKSAWNHYDPIKKEWKHVQTNFTSGMVQSWNKFCFTGGIVEVDVILPGNPYIGGLWPAIWMLGNLGRATYEASTNNVWPWSFDTCDRELQPAQTISACNAQNHFGMHPFRGRGATEIDIIEVMTGGSDGKPIPGTNPSVSYPYADFTLQVAPGVSNNRPQSGSLPIRKKTMSKNGHTEFFAQTWYDGLKLQGNTSINPFFYGTYLAETKPNEPVTRTKEQAFQADAVGVVHQLTPAHFKEPHTIRLEWQPGRGGRLDWYVKGYKVNKTFSMTGDGKGQDWINVYSLQDDSLKELMKSQIPMEPSYLIMNTAVSSTWGFPYDAPDWCPKCYDCENPKCACSFFPGFCPMLDGAGVAMYIDSLRVYQSKNDDAHVGQPHSVGCDPPEYPTKEWIHGKEYRYMRNPPFVLNDKKPLRLVQRGGGSCKTHADCGASIRNTNLTLVYEQQQHQQPDQQQGDGGDDSGRKTTEATSSPPPQGRGRCVASLEARTFMSLTKSVSSGKTKGVCSCHEGFTGPHCLSIHHIDDSPSAYELRSLESPFRHVFNFHFPVFLCVVLVLLAGLLVTMLSLHVRQEKRAKQQQQRHERFVNKPSPSLPPHSIMNTNHKYSNKSEEQQSLLRPMQVASAATTDNVSVITGSSV